MKSKELLERYAAGERDFSGISLKSAQLEGVTLTEINLSYANLYGANLFKAEITKSNLIGITLSKADLRSSNLQNVNLSQAKLYGTDFREATLEEILFSNANLKQANFTGARVYNSDFTGAKLIRVEGLILEPHREKQKDIEETDFRCGYCKLIVPAEAYGTAHRNHCPTCGYSKHVDERKGFRNSDCQSLMEPIGLSWKRSEEISLVHLCLGCNTIDKNRIAGDDNPLMLLEVYEKSKTLDPTIINLLATEGIELIKPEEEYKVKIRLFGKY
ncbi:MAG: RNHCP domain-containing protein [Candidatus Heimdallarchaeaceae archaeon]